MTASVGWHGNSWHGRQIGMVLLLCLLLLTALTLVGLSATADTILQSQLSSNLQDTERAKQSAQAALAWAEHWLLDLKGAAPQTCDTRCDGLYLHAGGSLPAHPERNTMNWWIANGHEAGVDPLTGVRLASSPTGSAGTAYWLIEALHNEIYTGEINTGNTGIKAWYRIVVRGTGRKDTAISVIESTLVRTWPLPDSTANSIETEHADEVTSSNCSPAGSPAPCGRVAWRMLR